MLWELAARNWSPKCHKEPHEKLLGVFVLIFPLHFLAEAQSNCWKWLDHRATCVDHVPAPASSSCPILLPSSAASSRGGISESHRDCFKMQTSLINQSGRVRNPVPSPGKSSICVSLTFSSVRGHCSQSICGILAVLVSVDGCHVCCPQCSGSDLGRVRLETESKNVHPGWIPPLTVWLQGCEVEQSWKSRRCHTAQPVKGSAWRHLLSCSGTD